MCLGNDFSMSFNRIEESIKKVYSRIDALVKKKDMGLMNLFVNQFSSTGLKGTITNNTLTREGMTKELRGAFIEDEILKFHDDLQIISPFLHLFEKRLF
jgi:hypothetical protein